MLGSKAPPLSASTKLAIVRHVTPRLSTSTQATAEATAVQTLKLGKSSESVICSPNHHPPPVSLPLADLSVP